MEGGRSPLGVGDLEGDLARISFTGDGERLGDLWLTDFSLDGLRVARSDLTLDTLFERDLRVTERDRDLPLLERDLERLRDLRLLEPERDLRLLERERDLRVRVLSWELERDFLLDLERDLRTDLEWERRLLRDRELQKKNYNNNPLVF